MEVKQVREVGGAWLLSEEEDFELFGGASAGSGGQVTCSQDQVSEQVGRGVVDELKVTEDFGW